MSFMNDELSYQLCLSMLTTAAMPKSSSKPKPFCDGSGKSRLGASVFKFYKNFM